MLLILQDTVENNTCHFISFFIHVIFVIPARDCGVLEINNAIINTTETIYGTVVGVICNPGYLLGSSRDNIVQCGIEGSWLINGTAMDFHECQRKN